MIFDHYSPPHLFKSVMLRGADIIMDNESIAARFPPSSLACRWGSTGNDASAGEGCG